MATVENVLQMYVQAVGGVAAVDHIVTREIPGAFHGTGAATNTTSGNKRAAAGVTGIKVICYWEKPDKVVEIQTSLFGMTSELDLGRRPGMTGCPPRQKHQTGSCYTRRARNNCQCTEVYLPEESLSHPSVEDL